jgi:hypothetical protein
MLSIKNYLDEYNIDISSFPQLEYKSVHLECAVGFSTPRGLLDTAEHFVHGIRRRTNKIEGGQYHLSLSERNFRNIGYR